MTLRYLDLPGFPHTLIFKLFLNAMLLLTTKCQIDIVQFPILWSFWCCVVQVRLEKVRFVPLFPFFFFQFSDSNPKGQDRYKQGSWSMGNYRWESLFQSGIQPLGSDHNHLLSLWMRLAITTINTSNSILAGVSGQLHVGLCLVFHGGEIDSILK